MCSICIVNSTSEKSAPVVSEMTYADIRSFFGEVSLNSLPSGNTRVLVLDDDEDTRFAICRILSKCDCDVVEAETVRASVEILEQGEIDVVFSDMRIPGSGGGEELLDIVVEKYPHVYMVLMSCAMEQTTRETLMEKGAAECLQKPFFKEICLELLGNFREPLKKLA